MKHVSATVMAMLTVVLSTCALDNHDWQLWTSESLAYKITEQWTAKLEGESYFNDDMSDPFYRHADISLSKKLKNWFTLGLNYRYVEQDRDGGWKRENRPHINGTFNCKAFGLLLSDRNRIEYRMPEDADDFVRYRNKLRVGLPVKWVRFSVEPYVSDEVFIDSEEAEVNQNRDSVGFVSSFPGGVKLDVYYMLLSGKKDDDWVDANILGTSLSLLF